MDEIVRQFLGFKGIDEKEFIAYRTAYKTGFNEAISQASNLVSQWAEPMDSTRDGVIKGILNEMSEHIAEIEPN